MTDVTHIGPLETQLQATLNSDPRPRSGGLQPLHYSQKGVLARCVRGNRLASWSWHTKRS